MVSDQNIDSISYAESGLISFWSNLSLCLACHGAHHLCSHKGSPVILQAGHHVRAKNNSPIFGVLTQPVPSAWNDTHEDQTFVESSNIEYLQAAGARVVHLDYRMSLTELKKELSQLNGIYIPGDTK